MSHYGLYILISSAITALHIGQHDPVISVVHTMACICLIKSAATAPHTGEYDHLNSLDHPKEMAHYGLYILITSAMTALHIGQHDPLILLAHSKQQHVCPHL